MEEGNPKAAITSFIQDKQNNIWFATNGEGIYYFSNRHLYLINAANGLSDLHVRSLALAANGDVLAATDQGINICNLVNGKATVKIIGPKKWFARLLCYRHNPCRLQYFLDRYAGKRVLPVRS